MLANGADYLRQEMRTRRVLTDHGIEELRKDILSDTTDLEVLPQSSW